jgi:hypothetical protein
MPSIAEIVWKTVVSSDSWAKPGTLACEWYLLDNHFGDKVRPTFKLSAPTHFRRGSSSLSDTRDVRLSIKQWNCQIEVIRPCLKIKFDTSNSSIAFFRTKWHFFRSAYATLDHEISEFIHQVSKIRASNSGRDHSGFLKPPGTDIIYDQWAFRKKYVWLNTLVFTEMPWVTRAECVKCFLVNMLASPEILAKWG